MKYKILKKTYEEDNDRWICEIELWEHCQCEKESATVYVYQTKEPRMREIIKSYIDNKK